MKMEFVKTFQHWTRGIMTALACVAVLGIPVTAQAVESSSPQALQQQRTVKGKVIDETGEPMTVTSRLLHLQALILCSLTRVTSRRL